MSRTWKWVIGVIAALVVVVGGSTAAYATYYGDRAIPGTTVAGQSVNGMTKQELTDSIEKRAEEYKLNVTVDGAEHEPTLQDVGVSVDAQATAARVMGRSNTAWTRIQNLFRPEDIPLQVNIDDATLNTYIDGLLAELGDAPKNGAIAFDADAASFKATPATTGHGLDTEAIVEHIKSVAPKLSAEVGEFESIETAPVISTEQAEAAAEEANALVAIPVKIFTEIRSIEPSTEDRAGWVSFEEVDGAAPDTVLNEKAVRDWLQATALSTNDEAKPGIHNVNSRGEVVSTPVEGSPSYTVNNADAVADALVEALRAGEAFEGKFEYTKGEQEFTTRLIADGAENMVYQAAPGEKWIDINLSRNTVSAYEGATIVQGPIAMVPGAPGTETVTGTFRVWHKNPLQTMRGFNLDGTPYETPNVPWATYFHGSYALHGAPWRSSFGWSGPGGSHGCVNMPVSGAKWFYDWADIGTITVSHY